MKNRNNRFVSLSVLTLMGLAWLMTGCTGSGTPAPIVTSYTQVERLARPALNEGLVLTNSNLNLWNSVAPSVDLSADAANLRTEVVGTLNAIRSYATGQGLAPAPLAQVVSGFLPDTMRIDTTKNFPGASATLTTIGGGMAYAGCVSATQAILCGGRKLRDNVVQITINYLANSTNAGLAGVPYDPGTQAPPALLAAFPYMAAPL